jgi:hypothetical protein
MARQRRPRDDDPPGHGFDEFYEANVQRLTLTLYAYTADLHLAQDCVQEAFTRAWPRWQRLVAYDNPAAWIRRVAMNIASSRWQRMRAARAHAHLHRDTVVDGPGPERVALARALATLPERQPSTPPSPTPDGQPTGEPATPTLQQSDVPTGFRYEGDSIRGDWTLEFAASTCEPPNPLARAPSAITQWEALFRTGSDPDEYLAIHQRVADYGTADAAEAYLEAVRRLAQGCVSILDEPSTWTVERPGLRRRRVARPGQRRRRVPQHVHRGAGRRPGHADLVPRRCRPRSGRARPARGHAAVRGHDRLPSRARRAGRSGAARPDATTADLAVPARDGR